MKLVFLLCFMNLVASKEVKSKYKIVWTRGLLACEDVTKNVVNVKETEVVRRGPDDVTLTGIFELTDDLPEGINMICRHMRLRENNWEYVFRTRFMNACRYLTRKNHFLTPFNKQLNISSCPIPKKRYKIDRLDLPVTTLASDVFLAAMVGEYKTRVEVYTKDKELILCLYAYNALVKIE